MDRLLQVDRDVYLRAMREEMVRVLGSSHRGGGLGCGASRNGYDGGMTPMHLPPSSFLVRRRKAIKMAFIPAIALWIG